MGKAFSFLGILFLLVVLIGLVVTVFVIFKPKVHSSIDEDQYR